MKESTTEAAYADFAARHGGRLWKYDWPKLFQDLGPHELRAYGFRYHGDPVAPQDDLTWFLIEKG